MPNGGSSLSFLWEKWPGIRALAAFLGLAIVSGTLLWPLCQGRALYWGDIILYFEPMQQFARHELLCGRLPLWNPYILCGQPFVGNPQMNVFYPSTLLLLYFPVWLAIGLNSFLHLFLCGAFMFIFLRRWTVYTLPAIAGAIVYMGSATILGRIQFPPMLQTAAYFPLLFAVLDYNIDHPSLRARLLLSITVAATLLAAHTQVAYLAFGCGSVYALMRLWRRREWRSSIAILVGYRRGKSALAAFVKELRDTLTQAGPLILASVFGLFLVAVYLLPAAQLVHESAREKMTAGQANRFFADFPHLLAVLFPRFTGHPATRDFWARGNAWEPAWFVGWTPLALAGYAAVTCRKENLVRFWLVIGLAGFWLAFGIVGGLYWLAFYIVPGLGSFHDPARFLLWTTLATAALTAVGLDALYVRLRWRSCVPGLVILTSILAPLIWFAGDWLPVTSPSNLNLYPVGVEKIRAATGTGRISVPANTLYWKRIIGDGYLDYGNSETIGLQRIENTLTSNLEMHNHLESASGYEPVEIGSYTAFDNLTTVAEQRREPNSNQLLRMLDVHLLLLPSLGGFPPGGYRASEISTAHGSALQTWPSGLPTNRAWMTRRVFKIEGRTRIAAAISAAGFHPFRTTIVSGPSVDIPLALQRSVPLEEGSLLKIVEWSSTRPGQIQLNADAGTRAALLVYSGTAFPGWKATVDGTVTPILCADGALIGIPLPPRRHTIILSYAPDMVLVGLYVSLSALAAAIALLVFKLVRNHSAFGASRKLSCP